MIIWSDEPKNPAVIVQPAVHHSKNAQLERSRSLAMNHNVAQPVSRPEVRRCYGIRDAESLFADIEDRTANRILLQHEFQLDFRTGDEDPLVLSTLGE